MSKGWIRPVRVAAWAILAGALFSASNRAQAGWEYHENSVSEVRDGYFFNLTLSDLGNSMAPCWVAVHGELSSTNRVFQTANFRTILRMPYFQASNQFPVMCIRADDFNVLAVTSVGDPYSHDYLVKAVVRTHLYAGGGAPVGDGKGLVAMHKLSGSRSVVLFFKSLIDGKLRCSFQLVDWNGKVLTPPIEPPELHRTDGWSLDIADIAMGPGGTFVIHGLRRQDGFGTMTNAEKRRSTAWHVVLQYDADGALVEAIEQETVPGSPLEKTGISEIGSILPLGSDRLAVSGVSPSAFEKVRRRPYPPLVYTALLKAGAQRLDEQFSTLPRPGRPYRKGACLGPRPLCPRMDVTWQRSDALIYLTTNIYGVTWRSKLSGGIDNSGYSFAPSDDYEDTSCRIFRADGVPLSAPILFPGVPLESVWLGHPNGAWGLVNVGRNDANGRVSELKMVELSTNTSFERLDWEFAGVRKRHTMRDLLISGKLRVGLNFGELDLLRLGIRCGVPTPSGVEWSDHGLKFSPRIDKNGDIRFRFKRPSLSNGVAIQLWATDRRGFDNAATEPFVLQP